MGAKQSMVKEAANRQFRAILPRVTDAINDVMATLNDLHSGEHAEQLVLDAKDAFWEVPLQMSAAFIAAVSRIRMAM